jgi:hypothetical protein
MKKLRMVRRGKVIVSTDMFNCLYMCFIESMSTTNPEVMLEIVLTL